MDPGAITALILAVAGLLGAVTLLIRDGLKRRRDSEHPEPPPQRATLPSVDPAGDTGPWPAMQQGGYPPVPFTPGLPPALATTLDRLEGVIAGLSGYARAEDIVALQGEVHALHQALEDYRLDYQQLVRSHETTRRALLALQEAVRDQSEQIGRLASRLEGRA